MARMRRARNYARTGYRKAKQGLDLSPTFIAGAVAGWTDLDKKVPAEVVLLGATAPVRGFYKVKSVCQGAIFGNTIKSMMANKGLSGTSAGGLL